MTYFYNKGFFEMNMIRAMSIFFRFQYIFLYGSSLHFNDRIIFYGVCFDNSFFQIVSQELTSPDIEGQS